MKTSDAVDSGRIAIALLKSLEPGPAANVAALLMGQLVRDCPEIYGDEVVCDTNMRRQAAIRFSTIILKGTEGQLGKLASFGHTVSLTYSCFSALGQALNNEYDSYVTRIRQESSTLVGVAVFGRDSEVRDATRSLSVL